MRRMGSLMSQTICRVGTSRQGSTSAVSGSGKSSMSLSWIFWKPRMLDPSKPMPSLKRSSVISPTGMLKCCQVPGRSVNRRSTIFTPCSLARAITSLGEVFGATMDSSIAMRSSCSPRGARPPVRSAMSARGRGRRGKRKDRQGAPAMDAASEATPADLVRGAQDSLGQRALGGDRLELQEAGAGPLLVLEVVPVDGRVLRPLLRHVLLGEDGVHRAGVDAGA